jgi:hypothetical protein
MSDNGDGRYATYGGPVTSSLAGSPAGPPADAEITGTGTADPAAAAHRTQDVAALHRFEVFLFVAVATVLVTRAYLAATGYPQVGNGTLHIAHVLWGGLLMGVAIVMGAIGMGSHMKTRAAFIGGIGFGLFIDEIGKFLTKEVDYFFTPSIAIMYVVFVLFYLVVRVVLNRRKLTDRRRLALAAAAVADQSLGQLTAAERAEAIALLSPVRIEADVAQSLRNALNQQPTDRPGLEERLSLLRDRAAGVLARFLGRTWVRRVAITLVGILIVVELLAYLLIAALSVTVDLGLSGLDLIILIVNVVTSGIVAVGLALLIFRRQIPGLRWIQVGLVVDLLVRQVLSFGVEQLSALSSFFVELVLLGAVRFWLRQAEAASDAGPDVRSGATSSAGAVPARG